MAVVVAGVVVFRDALALDAYLLRTRCCHTSDNRAVTVFLALRFRTGHLCACNSSRFAAVARVTAISSRKGISWFILLAVVDTYYIRLTDPFI